MDPFDYCYVPITHGGNAMIMGRKYELMADNIEDEGGFNEAFENHVEVCFGMGLEWRDHAKKLKLLGGIRYLLPVIEAAHKIWFLRDFGGNELCRPCHVIIPQI